jgi:hypothetical protein
MLILAGGRCWRFRLCPDDDGRKRRNLSKIVVRLNSTIGMGAYLDHLARCRGKISKRKVLSNIAPLSKEACHHIGIGWCQRIGASVC